MQRSLLEPENGDNRRVLAVLRFSGPEANNCTFSCFFCLLKMGAFPAGSPALRWDAKNAERGVLVTRGRVFVLEELLPGDPAQVGPYRLTGVLGAGGMGRVFLGWSSGGRPVAVKVIRPELAGDPEFRARFRREVAAARTISGLYTALLVDADTDSQVPWLATAYVDGPSLSEAVAKYGPLPAGSVRALAAGLAEALAAVHALGLVHRDLKPSNVLLASDGPRVIDFGISRAADTTTVTSTGQSVGSPGYLSPEQAMGEEVGPASDIFSLGAVLAFAGTGAGPFGAGSLPALVYRVVHQPPALDEVPAELRPLIERCLAKDPGDRPAAADLLAELADVQPGARWLPAAITAALAAFAVPAPPAAGYEQTATSVTPPPVPVARAGDGNGAAAPGAGRPRRFPRLRRSLLVPVLSGVAVVAALSVALAATLDGGGPETSPGGGSSAALAATAHPARTAARAPAPPSNTSAPRPSPTHKAPVKQTVPAPPASTVIVVTQAPPAPAPTTSKPPGPKEIVGTFSLFRTVTSCTYSHCTGGPWPFTFDCPSTASCTVTEENWGTRDASFNGTTLYWSFSGVGQTSCDGVGRPDTATLDITVLAWSAGTGGAARTPTQMQGTYDFSSPAYGSCHDDEAQETVTYPSS